MVTKRRSHRTAIWLAALSVVMLFTTVGTAQAQRAAAAPQTLDDLFEAVARRVPEFGGMFLGHDGTTLRVYLTDVRPETVDAAEEAIAAVFDAAVVPEEGIKAQKGRYGFSDLRRWYFAMADPILSIGGVAYLDIDEARNQVRVGVETGTIQREIMEQLQELGIPRPAVFVDITEPVTHAHTVPSPFPPLHTVQSPFSPRQGGYILTRLLCNQTGIGITGGTLGFNAFALSFSGNIRGFVTNSHNTAAWWKVDTAAGFPVAQFYQAPGYYPSELVGQETTDYAGFQGFPCPATKICRYSDSAFVAYNPSVTSAHAMIARTTGLTTSISSPVLTISHTISLNDVGPGRYGIAASPSQPYLVGLTLNKVGRTTGWTQGTITQTNVTMPVPIPFVAVVCPGNKLDATLPPSGATYLSQYVVSHPVNDVVDGGDSGSPVFRISNAAAKHVELYGILWGRIGYKDFVFSPIGGSPYQPAGIQTDLGPLDYVGLCLPPSLPCQ